MQPTGTTPGGALVSSVKKRRLAALEKTLGAAPCPPQTEASKKVLSNQSSSFTTSGSSKNPEQPEGSETGRSQGVAPPLGSRPVSAQVPASNASVAVAGSYPYNKLDSIINDGPVMRALQASVTFASALGSPIVDS